MAESTGPSRGARLLILPRYFAHLSETEEYDALIVCDGPLCAAKQPAFHKEAYGLFHALVSACESLGQEVCDPIVDPIKYPERAFGIVREGLVGDRVHYIGRRNGLAVYAKFAVEDQYIVALSIPKLPVPELGAALLDAVVADLTSMPCPTVVGTADDDRHKAPMSSSLRYQLSADSEEWRLAFKKRATTSLQWVEAALSAFVDTEPTAAAQSRMLPQTGVGSNAASSAVWSLVTRRGTSPCGMFHNASDELAQRFTTAANIWLAQACSLHRPFQESVIAFSSADAACRWTALGGAVWKDGVVVSGTLSSQRLSRAVHMLAVRHGAIMSSRPADLDSARSTPQTLRIDVSALLNEISRVESQTVSTAVDSTEHHVTPALPSDRGMLIIENNGHSPGSHATSPRAILELVWKANICFAVIFVPSSQPYQGTHLDAAERVMISAVEHLIGDASTPPAALNDPVAALRLTAPLNVPGSTLQTLLERHRAELVGAAAIAPSRDLRWVELPDPEVFLDATLQAALSVKNSNIDAEAAAKFVTEDTGPAGLCRAGVVAALLSTATECIRCARAECTMVATGGAVAGSSTAVQLMPRGELGSFVPADDADLLGVLLSGAASHKASALKARTAALKGAMVDLSTPKADPTKVFYLASHVFADHPGEGSLNDEIRDAFELTAVSCLVRVPVDVPTPKALGIALSAARALAYV